MTQDRVAAEAHVTRTHVCHVLAGRFTSARVLRTAERLVAEANAVAEAAAVAAAAAAAAVAEAVEVAS